MFAAGGLARATINAAADNKSKVGGAATFFVFLYTAIFGGESRRGHSPEKNR